jgi:hypothetical protein
MQNASVAAIGIDSLERIVQWTIQCVGEEMMRLKSFTRNEGGGLWEELFCDIRLLLLRCENLHTVGSFTASNVQQVNCGLNGAFIVILVPTQDIIL